jgi:hypothetical protein
LVYTALKCKGVNRKKPLAITRKLKINIDDFTKLKPNIILV